MAEIKLSVYSVRLPLSHFSGVDVTTFHLYFFNASLPIRIKDKSEQPGKKIVEALAP